MWYNEPQYLADIEEHLGVTIQQVRLQPTQQITIHFVDQKKRCTDAALKSYRNFLIPTTFVLYNLTIITHVNF